MFNCRLEAIPCHPGSPFSKPRFSRVAIPVCERIRPRTPDELDLSDLWLMMSRGYVVTASSESIPGA